MPAQDFIANLKSNLAHLRYKLKSISIRPPPYLIFSAPHKKCPCICTGAVRHSVLSVITAGRSRSPISRRWQQPQHLFIRVLRVTASFGLNANGGANGSTTAGQRVSVEPETPAHRKSVKPILDTHRIVMFPLGRMNVSRIILDDWRLSATLQQNICVVKSTVSIAFVTKDRFSSPEKLESNRFGCVPDNIGISSKDDSPIACLI